MADSQAPLLLVTLLLAARRAGVVLLPHPEGAALAPAKRACWRWRDGPVPLREGDCDWPLQSRPLLAVATSGSSGTPRLVLHSFDTLNAAARAVNGALGLRVGDRWLQCLSLQHIGGLAILFRCALADAMPVLAGRFETARLAALFPATSPTHLSLVPAMLWRLLEAGVPPPPSLRRVLLGGQAGSPAVVARAREAGWPVCVSYGASETGSAIAIDCGVHVGRAVGDVGRPLPGCEVRLDRRGRILLRAPQAMLGYLDVDGRLDPARRDGWLRLDDLAEIGDDGRLHILGRADELLLSGGLKVHPARVEAALAGMPGLGEVAVTGVPDAVWGDRLVLFYTGPLSRDAVRALCAGRLQGAERPRVFRHLDALPRLASGKPDRQALRALAASDG